MIVAVLCKLKVKFSYMGKWMWVIDDIIAHRDYNDLEIIKLFEMVICVIYIIFVLAKL